MDFAKKCLPNPKPILDQKIIKYLKISIFLIFGQPDHFPALFIAHQMIRAAHRRNTESIRNFLRGAPVVTNYPLSTSMWILGWRHILTRKQSYRSTTNGVSRISLLPALLPFVCLCTLVHRVENFESIRYFSCVPL